MRNIKSVLLVCTGNSCRSIMAEGLLKKYLKELGREDIAVQSAGIGAVDGLPPTPETVKVMREVGVDVSGLRSKSLTDEMVIRSDLILVMASNHMDDIIRRVPEAASKVHLLRQFDCQDDKRTCEDLDIMDPIGQPVEFYKVILDIIKKDMERIASIL